MFRHDRITRILSLLLCFLFAGAALLSIPFAAQAEDELKAVSGKAASFTCRTADTLEVNGQTFKSGGEDLSFTVHIKTDDATNAYSVFTLNGRKYASLVNGDNDLTIRLSDLEEGENALGILLGAGSDTYKTSMVYGTYNLDDIAVQSVTFEGIATPVMRLRRWMAIVGDSGVDYTESDYAGGSFNLGDGWYEDTGLGGSMPEMPVAAEILFDKPDMSGLFYVDTTLLPDGETEFMFKKDGKVVETRTYRVDNTGPDILFTQPDGAILYRDDSLDADAKDAGGKTVRTLYVDGERVSRVRLDKMKAGDHCLSVLAEDKQGNTSFASMLFKLVDRSWMWLGETGSVTAVNNGQTLYTAEPIETVILYENPCGTFSETALRSSDEKLTDINGDKKTEAAGEAYPYQSFVFEIDPNKQSEFLISYIGQTGNGVPIDLKVYNPETGRWDSAGQAVSGEPFTAILPSLPYAKTGKVRVNAMPHAVYNGSNTLLWDSDTQYYSAFEDLFPYYTRINEYAVDEYNKGNIGYVVHTGDLVDQSDPADEANLEYKRASEAQDILDKANVPNGVVSGNHDIRHTAADYKYYLNYFPASRYEDFDWYGGQLNDNVHHYDLISLGTYDFLFLYIGCYRETDEDFLSWANEVCKAYPNRNVVLCLHEYLLPSGEYSGDRAEVLWDKLIVPNENVKMVLCGHNDGVADRMHAVEGTDRAVLEILADYQFAENGQGPQHIINNCTCDGEGYIRLMTFNNLGQVVSRTYSPVADDYGIDPFNYFPAYLDSFTYDVDLIPSDRSLQTLSFIAAFPGEATQQGSKEANSSKLLYAKAEDGSLSSLIVRDPEHRSYEVPETDKPSPEAPDKRVTVSGREGVDPALHVRTSGKKEDLSFVETGVDLIPADTSRLMHTSGSNQYTAEITESGALHISHLYNNANWVTLVRSLNESVDFDVYNRLYFSVTAAPFAKWNLELNLNGQSYSFSRTEGLAKKFGYRYQLPSDITGTWSGYIDLSEFVSGKGRINSVYFVAATPEQDITFDYLILGRSDGGSVTFRIDENEAEIFEGPVGTELKPNDPPEPEDRKFIGWFNGPEPAPLTDTAETVFKAEKEGKTVYAAYALITPDDSAPDETENEKMTYANDELPFPALSGGFPLWAILLLIAGGVLLIAAVILIAVLAARKKKE